MRKSLTFHRYLHFLCLLASMRLNFYYLLYNLLKRKLYMSMDPLSLIEVLRGGVDTGISTLESLSSFFGWILELSD